MRRAAQCDELWQRTDGRVSDKAELLCHGQPGKGRDAHAREPAEALTDVIPHRTKICDGAAAILLHEQNAVASWRQGVRHAMPCQHARAIQRDQPLLAIVEVL